MDMLNDFLSQTALQYPVLLTLFLVLGVFRAIFKPLMSLVEVYVKATGSASQQATLDGFEKSKFYSALVWFVDFLMSVKLPVQQPPKDVTPAAPAVVVAPSDAPKNS